MKRLVMLATALWLSAAPSMAQVGVHVDPESPTAKEYALPLESARRQASGKTGFAPGGGARTTPAPRFGEGLAEPAGNEDAGSPAASRSGSGAGGSRSSASSGQRGSGNGSSSSGQIPRAAAVSRPGAPDGGGTGTTLLIAGGGVALLLLGGAAGFALRRRTPAT